MSELTTFDELHSLSAQQIRHRFGGKALGLYEAYQLSIPIPPTWLINTSDHEAFLKTDPSLEPDRFRQEAARFVKKRIGSALENLETGNYAVRSSCQAEDSAHHSFAGIFETQLNVSKDDLAEAIAFVWSSSLEVKALTYSQTHSLMGVLIQPMIEAKFAGICFTVHPSPSTLFNNQAIVVEYAATSGEKVVQGEVTPFRLCGTSDILSFASENGWMDDLLKAIFELKKRYHHEADIEFAVDGDERFWLLQQRPISKIYHSKTLDLSAYKRMYKRSVPSLDIELLIDGCSRFLAPYLELSLPLERWMVMTTNEQGVQELWVDEILNETIVSLVIRKIEHETDYLSLLESRYADHYNRLTKTDLSPFFSKTSLTGRLFSWFEWITPFTAHYYAPMFVIDALYSSILREIRSIDPANAEGDLFELGTAGVASLIDLLNQELRPLKKFHTFKECAPKLKELAHRFGFMKCRQVYEDPYTPEELFEMIQGVPDLPAAFDNESFEAKKKKYFHQEHLVHRLNHLREWMRIRNQEMEYLLFAFLESRPLLDEVCKALSIQRETLWRSSRKTLLMALETGKPLELTPMANLTIVRANGRMILSDQIELRTSDPDRITDLKGRTVYGKGTLEATVRIAFAPEELNERPVRPCVLVTGMTTPDFVPMIRKNFDALITDEGGILCHAAIIARELPIPCIVGTGVGSSILQDGMRVRIDFDRSEIQIITG